MEYKIKIDYTTGNSFHTENTFDYLEIEWEDLNKAKENLVRIKEHYQQYRDINSYSLKKSKEEIFEENKDKAWFVDDGDEYHGEYCLKLETDNGNDYQLRAFWCGYFESLRSAEIEIDKSDLKIEFY